MRYDSVFAKLPFRYLGPDGNRSIAVAGVPGNRMVSYVGAASGGIFKTEDAGLTWAPIFDDQDNSSIGALAIAPSNPNHVWAGTGETFLIRPAHAMGNGVYKSTDAGKTWTNMGLQATGRISRVIVHPTNPDIVYVASLGNTHTPQQERGIYKTTDGGKTWQRILFVNENTGCSDLSMNPKNPDILYAATWQVDIKTWNLNSGGPGSGIYRSKDGGKTWQPLRNGLPGGDAHPVGKTSVDVAYSNPDVVYALIQDKEPGLYRSADGGDSWKLMNRNHSMAQRGSYYTRLRVAPDNENKVHTICVTIMTTLDGGKSFTTEKGDYRGGGDCHDMWLDPLDSNRIMVAHDIGMNMTFNNGKTWQNINLPIAQLYHVAVDNQVPYNVFGNRQDGSSYRGPSNSLGRGITTSMWMNVGGCESGFAQPDPVDNNIVWSGCYDGGLDVFNVKTGHARDVRAWPEAGYGWAPKDMKYRWHWNFPMIISKHNHNKVFIGSQYVHQTTNGGQSWQVISSDLTTNDKTHQENSGGISNDNLFTFDGCTLFSMAESPLKEGVIWTGTNDGQVQLTRDGGKTWKNVTANIKGMPAWGTIRCIDASRFDAGTAYIAVSFQQLGDFKPYIFKTTNYGESWSKIGDGIPASNSSTVHQVIEDPAVKGLLWAGTDNALYFSPDDGSTWVHLKNNLPPAPIYGIAIQENFKDLVLATYGRGFYILDDLTPIREYARGVQEKAVHLFTIRKAYRFQDPGGYHSERGLFNGQNPTYGASINYYLKEKVKDSVHIEILDAEGKVLQKLRTQNQAGVNRVHWDLRLERLVLPDLLTKPRGKEWVNLDAAGKRAMTIYDLDIGPGMVAPLVPPGQYRVRLTAGNEVYEQPLTVVKDPNTLSTQAAIMQQYAFGKNLFGAINSALATIKELEQIRAAALAKAAANPTNKNVLTGYEEELWKLEARLHDVYQTGARQDAFRSPIQVLERLLGISKEALAGAADFAPTDQHQAVFRQLNQQLEAVKKDFASAKAKPVYKEVMQAKKGF
ncbi:glycosyl hydrolase [Segetibacter sp. 3557_3]|nr:glycosyl hydrolase [Segetibacter sp. 3557_3]